MENGGAAFYRSRKIGNKDPDVKKKKRVTKQGGSVRGLWFRNVTHSRAKASRYKDKNGSIRRWIARSFNLSRFYSFSSASQPPTRPKLHLFEIIRGRLLSSPSLRLSRRFFSSSFLEAPLQGEKRKRITAPNFTAHGWNLRGLFHAPLLVLLPLTIFLSLAS